MFIGLADGLSQLTALLLTSMGESELNTERSARKAVCRVSPARSELQLPRNSLQRTPILTYLDSYSTHGSCNTETIPVLKARSRDSLAEKPSFQQSGDISQAQP